MNQSMRRAPRRFAALMVVGLVSVLAVAAARAESTGSAGARPARVTEGTMFWRTERQEALVPAPVLKTDVHMVVTGIVARASVRQEFINPGSEWAEGVYVFPLPEDAAVDHLRMQIGDRSIEGVIQERASAKAQYEQAKHEGKRASLVEEERPNIFTTSVANIAPGAAITVEIEYQQAIRYDAGQFRLRFPMVIGPRYIRDTHFRFLERVQQGDEIIVEGPDRRRSRLRVQATSVVDSRTAVIRTEDWSASLVLVTCYPFDAVRPGGPLRYVVTASASSE